MRKALGKGIDALISRVDESSGGEQIRKIRISDISPNKYQPRKTFKKETLEELSQSIKKHGLTQPIVVAKKAGKYEIIVGERRWRAAKMAGLSEIDAVVKKEVNDEQQLAFSLIENIQREDLNAVDEALAYKRLMENFHINQSELGTYCGKSRSAISNTLRILELSEEIKKAIQTGLISGGHARALLAIPDRAKRKQVFEIIISEKWSVRDVENFVRKLNPTPLKKKSKKHKNPEIKSIESELEKRLGTKVEIKTNTVENGKIIITYCSHDDFNRIYSILTK